MASKELMKLMVTLGVDTGGLTKGLDQAKKTSSTAARDIAGAFGPGVLQFATLTGAIAGVTAALKFSIDAASEAQQVDAQLNAVLKSTHYAAGLSAEELDKMAVSLSRMTMYDDEAVKSAENMLLTFTNIGKEVFPDATQTVLDMSTALGQDLKSSAIQLGKALNDPILGITALQRVGVNFTKEQKEMVKGMVESGHTMEAQEFILNELNTEFGGSAAAAANTYKGQITQLKNEVGNLGEAFGKELLPDLTEVVSAIKDLTIWITDNKDAIKKWWDVIQWANPGKWGVEIGDAIRGMLGLNEETEAATNNLEDTGNAAGKAAEGMGEVADAAEAAAEAEKLAADAAKELTETYKGLLSTGFAVHKEREGFEEKTKELKQAEEDLQTEVLREQLAYYKLRQEGKLTQEQVDEHVVAYNELQNKLAENSEAQAKLTQDTQDATKKRIYDTVQEGLAKDGINTQEFEFLQNLQVQQGLITRADADRAIQERAAADSIISDYERQNAVTDITQQKLDALVNGSPYVAQIKIETIGNILTIGGGSSKAPTLGGRTTKTARAGGGDALAGMSYLVGERGPEILTMGAGQSGYVTSNDKMGGGTTVNVYNPQPEPASQSVRRELTKLNYVGIPA